MHHTLMKSAAVDKFLKNIATEVYSVHQASAADKTFLTKVATQVFSSDHDHQVSKDAATVAVVHHAVALKKSPVVVVAAVARDATTVVHALSKKPVAVAVLNTKGVAMLD